MKIVLLESVRGLGNPGDIVNVKSGYARNYLIPKSIAIYASEGNIKNAQHQIEIAKQAEIKTISNLQEIAVKLNKLTLKFELEVGEEDKLFGSVTNQMIAEQLLDNGYNIERKDISINDPIKALGNHYVDIHLHKDVSAKIKIKVKALEK